VSYGGQGFNYNYHNWYGNLNLYAASPTIQNCTISGSGSYGVELYYNSSPTVLSNTISANDSHGSYGDSSSSPVLQGNMLSDNGGYGWYSVDTGSAPSLLNNAVNNNGTALRVGANANMSGNTFGGNVNNYIVINGGTVSGDRTWERPSGDLNRYVVSGDVTVNAGVMLTVEPGLEVGFNDSTRMNVNGALRAVGKAGQPIVFTANSAFPVAGSWAGIYFGDSSDDALTRLEHCTVSYGGQGFNYNYHNWYGNLNLYAASPTIQNCTISDGGSYGLQLYNNSTPTVISNSISNNGSYGLYNESSVTVMAENNWWGLPSGPYHPTLNPGGQGDRVSDYVDFDPWLDAPPWANKTGLVYGVTIQNQGASALAMRFAYNGLHQLTHVNASTPVVLGYEFTYNLAGDLTRVEPSGGDPGVVGAYSYDALGNLAALTNTHAGGATINALTYDVDNLGNVTSISDGGDTTTYTYDELYRLSGVAYPGGETETYTYDAVGNRLSRVHSVNGTVTFTYNDANQLTASTANGGTTYTYDANGNLRTRTDASGTTTFAWNGEGQLTRIDYADATYSTYSYDGLGQRLSKRDRQGNVTYYVYAGRSLALELDQNGDAQAVYVYTPHTDHPLAVVRGGATYHFVYDHLGSVIGLADEAGSLAASYQYDPWGNLLDETGSVANPMRFAGQLYDAESGLYYMRNRYYDPEIGRFIGRDPFVEELPPPGRLNLYAYADNNPVNVVDAFGLLTVEEAAGRIYQDLNSPEGQISVALIKEIAAQGGGFLKALSARVNPSAGSALLGVMTTFLSPEGAEAMRGAINIVKGVRREQRIIDDLYNRDRRGRLRRGRSRFVLRPGIHNAARRIREARQNSRVLNFLLSP
jgi:RHS repeat-associated protein